MQERHAIFGPPGTGKTTRLTQVIKDTVDDRHYDTVAVLSFTKAAAKVLTTRVRQKDLAFIGTIHALAFNRLGLQKSQVADINVFNRWVGGYIKEVEFSLAIRSYAKRNNTDLIEAYAVAQYSPNIVPLNVIEFYIQSYENWKESNFLVDFDDMIDMAIGNCGKFDAVIVDEAQDLSRRQWDLINSLLHGGSLLIMAGDDDQSIFTWSGAHPQGMIEQATSKEILTQSWRIPPELQEIAERTIGQIIERVPKVYKPRQGAGELRFTGDYDPLAQTEPHTVLLRSQWGIKKLEDEFINLGIPYIGGRNYFNTPRARLMRAIQAEDFASVNKLRKYLRTDAQDKPFPTALDINWLNADETEYDYLQRVDLSEDPLATLSTIHGFKGEEDNSVFLILDCSHIVESATDTQLRFEDEVRVWYVGLTRAKVKMTIVGFNQFVLT